MAYLEEKRYLGENCEISTNSEKTQLNNNIIVCAPSGAGKTMSYAEMVLLETKYSSIIATVSKKSLVDKYVSWYQKRGFKAEVINFASPANSTVGYDPLKYVDSFEDANMLSDAIIMANPKKRLYNISDPYWDDSAKALLTALILKTMMNKKGDATFDTVLTDFDKLEVFGSGDQIVTSLDEEFQKMGKSSYAYSNWRTFCSSPLKTANCILSTLSGTLAAIFTPSARKLMRMKKKLNIKSLATERGLLFIVTSAVNPALHSYVQICNQQMIAKLFEFAEERENGRLPLPVHFLMDDFANGCRMPLFPQYISIFREKGISASILIQNESQLSSMYGENDKMTIISNCDRYIYLGSNDLATAKNISIKLNLPLEEVLYMPIGKEYVFQRGQRPIYTDRYNILNNTTYKTVTANFQLQKKRYNMAALEIWKKRE